MSRFFSLLRKNSFQSNPSNKNDWRYAIGKWAFNLSRYNRLGLYTDDLIMRDDPILEEALRRMPKNVLDGRNFRLIRAVQLDFLKMELPREKWITYEQDLEYKYLKPYVDEIIKERWEIYNYGCTNYREHHWPEGLVK